MPSAETRTVQRCAAEPFAVLVPLPFPFPSPSPLPVPPRPQPLPHRTNMIAAASSTPNTEYVARLRRRRCALSSLATSFASAFVSLLISSHSLHRPATPTDRR